MDRTMWVVWSDEDGDGWTKMGTAGRRWGRTLTISPHQMRQLYQAVAMPSFTYAADVWFTPICRDMGEERFRGSIGMACKLSTVQRMATTAVTGALCTSASDVMEVHTNLLPIELMFNKVCHRATLRLVALLETHPLFKPVQQKIGRAHV